MGSLEGMPEQRRGALRRLLREKPFLRVIEASNGLSAIIAQTTKVKEKNGEKKALMLYG